VRIELKRITDGKVENNVEGRRRGNRFLMISTTSMIFLQEATYDVSTCTITATASIDELKHERDDNDKTTEQNDETTKRYHRSLAALLALLDTGVPPGDPWVSVLDNDT
jgi:hypothetical protein